MEPNGLDESDEDFVEGWVGYGDAAQAAREVGLSEKSAKILGCRKLHEPKILAACLMRVVEMVAEGQRPVGRVVRRLRKVAPECLRKGLNQHGVDGLPPVEEAYRQFRLVLGLDKRRTKRTARTTPSTPCAMPWKGRGAAAPVIPACAGSSPEGIVVIGGLRPPTATSGLPDGAGGGTVPA